MGGPAGRSADGCCWPGIFAVAVSSFSMPYRLPVAMRAVTFLPGYVSHMSDVRACGGS